MTEKEAALLLTLIPGVKPLIARTIAEKFGSFATYFHSDPQALPRELRAPAEDYLARRSLLDDQLAMEQENLARQQICFVSITDESYPSLLREIYSPPPLLFVKGCVDLLALPQIAIVGSRRASRWGLAQAHGFASALANSGFTVTSGLALGIDGAAHRGAIKTGSTIAVLGCGVDVIYPRQHAVLYEEIVANGGAIVSEFSPGTRPLRQHFPRRNRIISGLSMGILVVEAAAKSGSLITARLAMEQGREVFAMPGSINNPMARGCHQLIREGAVLTESLDDMVSQLGGFIALKAEESKTDRANELPEGDMVRKVLDAMGYEPVDVDTLTQVVDVGIAELMVALVNLEIGGYIEKSGGAYQRIR